MPRSYFTPDTVFKTTAYSHAVKVGNTIYVAGQVAVGTDGNLVGKGDVKAQAEQAWKNMKNVLEAAGATIEDLVDVTTYIVNPDDVAKIREVRQRYLPENNKPTSTLIVAQALANPDLLIEIKGIAVVE